MTSENTTAGHVSRRGNILIEENLTPMQKLTIYLAFTGLLFLRSVSFCYQEEEYADPGHPQHEHYKDATISKRVNLAAAVLVFVWYLYNTFLVEPFYHKYVTRRSQLRTNNSLPGQQDRPPHKEKEEKTPSETTGGLYSAADQKTRAFRTMDLRNQTIKLDGELVDKDTVVFRPKLPDSERKLRSNQPPKLPLPKKMTLDEFREWRTWEMAYKEIKEDVHIPKVLSLSGKSSDMQ